MRQEDLFNSVCEMSNSTTDSDADSTVSTSTDATGQTPTNKNIKFEDGEWWYHGLSNGSRQRLTSHQRKNSKRMFVNGKYVPQSHPLWKAGRYKSFDDAAFSGLENYERSTEGMVYIITNPAWPKWVKIGMAVDADDRCNGYQTSSPFRDYEVVATISTNDRRKAEAIAHQIAEGMASDRRNEWFKLKKTQARQVLVQVEEKLNGL